MIDHVINTLNENQDRFTCDEQVVIMTTLADFKAAASLEPWVITDGEAV